MLSGYLPPDAWTPPGEEKDFARLFALIALITDPKETRKRVDELSRVAADARELIAVVEEGKAELAAARQTHEKELKQQRASHDAKLLEERDAFEVECARRRRELDERERETAALLSSAKADAEAAARARADLQSRLEQMQALAR